MPFNREFRDRESETETSEASITELLKRLGRETGELVRAEVSLAKLELREVTRQAALDGAKVGAGAALALVGFLALVAWMILGLGDLLGGRHATAALVVGIVFIAVGALVARSAAKRMSQHSPAPTAAAIRQDAGWFVEEASSAIRNAKHGDNQ